jgi:hypothetical protein
VVEPLEHGAEKRDLLGLQKVKKVNLLGPVNRQDWGSIHEPLKGSKSMILKARGLSRCVLAPT